MCRLPSSSSIFQSSCLGIQAALEGALSTLANLADQSAEAQQAALENGLADILVSCLQQALNGAPMQPFTS